jgi:AraC family transcriptional regulator
MVLCGAARSFTTLSLLTSCTLLGGSYRERYRHREQQFGPLTIMFRPAGIPHQDEIGPCGVRFFEIELRPSWRQLVSNGCGGLEHSHQDCSGGRLVWLAMALFRELHGAKAAPDLCAEALLAEMVFEIARMRRERMTDAPGWLGRVLDKLHSEYCRSLTLQELSCEAGVHPVHLSRVFRKCTGESIGNYVHRLRIRQACEQMLSSTASLSEISFGTGFADQSHFTRAFGKITGMSPSRFRRATGVGRGIGSWQSVRDDLRQKLPA